jgi:hypothetical protein
MKTQVIHIESYDSLPSVQDKISKVEAFRLILVDNPSAVFICNKSAFVRILRTCSSLGIQLGIVSKRIELRALCNEYGVTVFEDLTSAQYKDWSENQLPKLDLKRIQRSLRLGKPADLLQKPENPVVRWISFSLAMIAVVLLLVSVLPSATIIIDTPDIADEVSYPLRLNPNTTVVSITTGVPITSLERTDEVILSQSVTETTIMPVGFASGEVTFTNLTEITGTIPAGTIIATLGESPILFLTSTDIIVEGKNGFQASGNAIAVEPGENGNVSAGMIQQIQAILPFQVQVSNPQSFVGGASEVVKIPGASDRKLIRSMALSALEDKIIKDIADDDPGNIVILPLTFRTKEILSEEYYPSAGEPGDTITIHLEISAQVDGIRKEDLILHFTDLVKLDLGDEITAKIDPDSIKIACTSGVSRENLSCVVTGDRMLSRKIDNGVVKHLVLGKTPNQASAAIRQYFPDISSVHIDTKPEGWFLIPLAPFRITVEAK